MASCVCYVIGGNPTLKLPSVLVLLAAYEPFRHHLVYVDFSPDYDILVAKTNNIVFANLLLGFSWIVLGSRSYESFSGFVALWLIGFAEFGLQKVVSFDFGEVLGRVEKVLRVTDFLGAVGYVGQAQASLKKQRCTDHFTPFDRRTQDARQFREGSFGQASRPVQIGGPRFATPVRPPVIRRQDDADELLNDDSKDDSTPE